MKKFLIPIIFWILVGIFVLVISTFFIPAIREVLQGPPFLALFVVFFLLGIVLIFLTIKEKIERILKKFLILTGASAIGFFVFVLLHNAVYGLFGVEEPFFFILAVIVCPIGFLVGVVGSIVLFLKKRNKLSPSTKITEDK